MEKSAWGDLVFAGPYDAEVQRVTLWEVINHAREAYLQTYRETIRAQRQTLSELTPETLVAINGADDVPEDYRFFRADLLWRDQGQPRLGTIRAGGARLPVPIETTYPDGGRVVTVDSFRWDDCAITATPAIQNDAALRWWLNQWIDRADRNSVDADGLRGAVHSLTPPQSAAGGALLVVVDFGSAPPEAFTQLISSLFASGAQSISIGTLPNDR